MGRRVAERPRRSRKRLVLAIVIPVAVLLVCASAAAWIATRAFAARDLLENAVPTADVIRDAVLEGDGEFARAEAQDLAKDTAEAVDLTSDPIWRVAEILPWAGDNLKAVRVAAEVTDTLVADVVLPATGFSLDEIKPHDGQIDIAAIRDASEFVNVASTAVRDGIDKLDAVDSENLVGQVRDGIDRLDRALIKVAEITDGAQPALELLPAMLGESGKRNYLFLFQNNAESRGTGGNPASLALITAEDGRLSITAQANSRDFPRGGYEPIIELDGETLALYGTRIGTQIQDVSLTPDFPTTARIATAYWTQAFGTPIDAVVSFDPIGLQRLLGASGPVTLSTGDTLTEDNAVELLLNGVYFRYPKTSDQDVFFAAAASTVFSSVTSGTAEVKPLIEALGSSVDDGNLMLWSAHAEEQALIDPLPIAGRLPTDNAASTTIAAYFSDVNPQGSKMDYYMGSVVTVDVRQCSVEGFVAVASVTLSNLISPDAVDDLPLYISGTHYDPGIVDTNIVVYGPVGASVTRAALDGADVAPDYVGTHLGRPVVRYRVLNDVGESHVVDVDFAGGPGRYAPVSVEGTPMVKATARTVSGARCA